MNYAGDAVAPARQAVIWSSEVQLYHDINDYRKRFLNDSFIEELNLPPQLAKNLKGLQYRPDLEMGSPPTLSKPRLVPVEVINPGGINLYPIANDMGVSTRTRGPYQNYPDLPPLSKCYDSEVCIGDYAGLVAFWVAGTNVTPFTSEAFYGQDPDWNPATADVLPPLNDGLSAWVGYRYSGNSEVYRYNDYTRRNWNQRPCGGANIPCDKARNIRNVMMFDEANATKDGVFPYTWPAALDHRDGPTTSDLACLYIAAIFYDLANEAGLGVHKADLLIWKSISLTTGAPLTMRGYGAKVQEAARALWPDPRPGRAGLSLYEEDVADVLTSRGIPLNGVSDFRTNLPVAIGKFPESLDESSVNGFGSSQPEPHPGVNSYGNHATFRNGYTDTNSGVSYMAYQFYKHSKYGPCDRLALSDGTFSVNPNAPFDWWYNNDGTYYMELTDREPGNVVVFLPGTHVRWLRSRQRCPNEATGFYAEDVRPFGFRVIKAVPNGFSFTASALNETSSNKTYQLTIVDPSLQLIGPATYAWAFTNHLGTTESAAGPVVQYTALKDLPFTLNITRDRSGQTDTLTLRERGNDFDRNGGNSFVRNLVP